MLFPTKAVLLSLVSLTHAAIDSNVQTLHRLQARDVLLGRQTTTTHLCPPVPPPATCASSCGVNFITCPGGKGNECYNPSAEVCCGDGTTCPAGKVCTSNLSCANGPTTTAGTAYTASTATGTKPTVSQSTSSTTVVVGLATITPSSSGVASSEGRVSYSRGNRGLGYSIGEFLVVVFLMAL